MSAAVVLYPVHEESDVVLRDGSTIQLRPVRTEDADKLQSLYEHLSKQSLYQRFFSTPRTDHEKAKLLCDVDYVQKFALVAEVGGEIVADARYCRHPDDSTRAEVAFTIADAFQGYGLGTRLLERLAEIAWARGVRVFDAAVLADNTKMMDVFLSSGFDVTKRLDASVFQVEFPLVATRDYRKRTAERAQKAAAASMRKFFEPRVVAVIGAARRRGHIGAEVFHNLVATGFTGTVVPVNPTAAEIAGVKAYPRVTDVPGPVDLAVIVVPAREVEAVVDDCIAKEVPALVVISAGFAETGVEGRAREAALLEKVRAAGLRMIGPNCMGILNTDPAVKLNAQFAPVYPPTGRVAMSTQSGALGLAILEYAKKLNIGISTFVSIGNKADVSGNDLIQYWAEDPRTAVILLYLESFGNPRRFARLARRISKSKPIIAVKSGRSSAGARAASSHTGALAGSDRLAEALFRQSGIIRTNTLEELFDIATLLDHQPVPAGRRVAILTNAGGPGILAADACEARGLTLPTLTDATLNALRSFLPAAASVANPVDMIASATPEHYARAMKILLADPEVDSLIVIFIPPLITQPEDVARAIVEGTKGAGGKTVLATFMMAQGVPDILASIPCYPFPESAATALARATEYGEWRARPEGTIPKLAGVNETEARAVVARVLTRGGGWLTPLEAQDLMRAVGIPAARARLASSAGDAAVAAEEIGLPVALKAVGPKLLHKSDVGGVKLGLPDAVAVREAFDDFRKRLGADLQAALVQEMVPGGVEVMVGAVTDPSFGPLVLYGSGGVTVELLSDVSFRIQPLTDVDVADMLDEVKGTALLRGFRGAPRGDEAALKDLLLRVSALLEISPEVQEMDINPVKVLPVGVRAVDVRVRVDHAPVRLSSRRIVY